MQVKLCSDALCWYCPRIAPHVPPNLGFFPYYTIADGNGGWVPLHERDAMMHDADERVRNVAHELFVTDKWMPENSVLAAWRRNPECDNRRVKHVACSTNLSQQTVLHMFEKLNDEHDRRAQHRHESHTGLHDLRLRGDSRRRPRPDPLLRPQAAHPPLLERTASSMLCPAAGQRSERKMVLPRPRRYPRLFPRTGTHKVQSPHETEPWQVLARTMVRARTRGPAHPSPHLRQPRTSPRRKRPRPPIQIRTRIRTPVLSCPSGRSWRRPQRGHARSAWAEEPSRGLPTISEQTRTLQCAAGATRTMRRMIAPSCSSLGPDGRMPRRREPLVECLLLGWLQHSATPRQFTIKQ